MHDVYLQDLVSAKLAGRGLPGSVHIRPNKSLATRTELGERATFVVEYDGVGAARLDAPEHEIDRRRGRARGWLAQERPPTRAHRAVARHRAGER